jgi:hypothetical protein
MIIIFDTFSGLCNQMYDIHCGINFCIINNFKFSFRYCCLRNTDLITWFDAKFDKLFDISLFKKYSDLYVNYDTLDVTNENSYNFMSINSIFLFKDENYINIIKNINKKFIILKQFWAIYKFEKIVDNVLPYIRPSKRLIDIYDKINSKIINKNEKYNYIHYRYESDFTNYFNIEIMDLKNVILSVKDKFKNPDLKIYIATTNINKLIDLKDSDICDIIITKNEDELTEYNFEEKAFIDYMFGINSNEVFGHSKSSFSCMLNSLKNTENYYNNDKNNNINNNNNNNNNNNKNNNNNIIMIPEDFYPEIYLELNPDVKQIFITNEQAVYHYLTYGMKENRIYKYSQIPNGFSLNYYLMWINKKNSNQINDIPFEGFKHSSSNNKNIYGVYFICCINNYLDIVKEQLNIIFNSGLYADTNELLIFVTLYNENNIQLKTTIEEFDIQNKCKLITTSENSFEKYAIRNYKKYINTTSDYYIYYFHTKGVGKNDISNTGVFSKRRQILNFFILKKYKIAIQLLEKYDAVGCSLFRYPKIHFSGNFWWSQKSHVMKLDDEIGDGYLAPEMYICSYQDGKYVSLNNNTNIGAVDNFINLSDAHILISTNDIPFNNHWDEQILSHC